MSKNVITFEINGKTQTAKVKDDVPFNALMAAISDGYEMCYLEDGSFMPELVDFAIEYQNIKTLTDIDIGDTANEAYEYIRAIDGVPSVDADFIADGIRAKVAYQEKLILAAAQSAGMSDIAEKLDSLFNGGATLINAAKKMVSAITTEVKKYKDVDLVPIIEKVANMANSEKEIAMGVLDYQAEKERILEQVGAKKPSSKKIAMKK